jgi:hypothetical protein
MSVILEALEKARRNHDAQAQHGGLLNQPSGPSASKKRGGFLQAVLMTVLVLSMLLIGASVAGVYLLWRNGTLQQFMSSATGQITPAGVAGLPASSEPALLQSNISSEGSPTHIPTPAPISSAAADAMGHSPFGDARIPAGAGARAHSDSRRVVAGSSSPGSLPLVESALDLPPPVPLHELPIDQVVGAPASAVGEFVLGPILYEDRDPIATVNGRIVRPGGDYGRFSVLRITPTSVTVRPHGGQPVTLHAQQ